MLDAVCKEAPLLAAGWPVGIMSKGHKANLGDPEAWKASVPELE